MVFNSACKQVRADTKTATWLTHVSCEDTAAPHPQLGSLAYVFETHVPLSFSSSPEWRIKSYSLFIILSKGKLHTERQGCQQHRCIKKCMSEPQPFSNAAVTRR